MSFWDWSEFSDSEVCVKVVLLAEGFSLTPGQHLGLPDVSPAFVFSWLPLMNLLLCLLSSQEQLGGDPSWAVWDLGQRT